MVTQKNVDRDINYLSEEFLRNFTVRFGILRLAFLFIIFCLIELVWLGVIPEISYFVHNQTLYSLLFIGGFGINLIYLLTWKKFKSLHFFIYLQLLSDIFLTFYIIFLTGGIRSSLFFILLVLIFLYGKILGIRISIYFSILSAFIYLIFGIIQIKYPFIWGEKEFYLNSIVFYFFLNLFGMILINILVYLAESREKNLFYELISQEISLNKAENLKKIIFDLLESIIFIIKQDGTLVSLNKKALDYLKAKNLSMALGKKLAYYNPELQNTLLKNLKRKEGFSFKSGDRYFWGKVSYLDAEDSYLVLLHETTELEKLQKKVFQMEKLASLGEMAAGVAHEIKNPLAGIKASLQLLQQEEDLEVKNRLLNILLREVDRLDKMVKDFIAFAKPKPGEREWVNLKEVVEEVLFLAKMTENKEIELELKVEDRIKVFWNKEHLKQVLLNLFLNAKEAALAGGKKVAIRLEKIKDDWVLYVEDNGLGIKKEHIKQIFEPFFSTKKTGVGLGLSIALRLCHLNEGNLEVDVNFKPGCRIILSLGQVKYG